MFWTQTSVELICKNFKEKLLAKSIMEFLDVSSDTIPNDKFLCMCVLMHFLDERSNTFLLLQIYRIVGCPS